MSLPKEKLTSDERRCLAWAALRGESPSKLAAQYGVARSWVYALAEEAKTDADAKAEEAHKEYVFRREVATLLKGEG